MYDILNYSPSDLFDTGSLIGPGTQHLARLSNQRPVGVLLSSLVLRSQGTSSCGLFMCMLCASDWGPQSGKPFTN